METTLKFLKELKQNNNKAWFDANKKFYKQAKDEFNDFGMKLIHGIEKFDPSIKNLELKDCTYRINRDLRFSTNKDPYKTHFGFIISKGGKKANLAGYYFHIEPKGSGFIGNNMICSGTYMLESKELESVRAEILDHPEEFLSSIKKASNFYIDESNKLKNAPKGFPADFEHLELLKLKGHCLLQNIDDKEILSKDLLDYCLKEFKANKNYLDILNKAIEYARETPPSY